MVDFICRRGAKRSIAIMLLSSSSICAPAFAQAINADNAKTVPATEVNGSASTPSDGVQEIVVTAQKRAQNLQDVPVAVTAISSDQLRAIRFQNVNDIGALAPGLSERNGAGGAQRPTFSLRGVYGVSITGQDQGIALYLDGSYINSATGASFDLPDVERIEVLRGPQGTLFGRNSIAGAINVISHDPTGRFGGHQEISYGNYNEFRSKTLVDLPEWNGFSATLSYLHYQRRGDIRNLGAGTVWDYTAASRGKYGLLTSPEYLGSQNVNSYAATVKYEASPNLTAVYKFHYSVNHYTDSGQGISAFNPDPNNAGAIGVKAILTTLQPNPAILTPVTNQRPDAVNNAFSVPGRLSTQDHNFTLTYAASDDITLKNLLAYRRSSTFDSTQLDGAGGIIFLGQPFAITTATTASLEKQWSDEFQANIHTQWFTLTAGYLHYDVRSHAPNLDGAGAYYTGFFPGHVVQANGERQGLYKTVSDAFFFQNELHLLSTLDVVVGSRLTHDKKSGFDTAGATPLPIVYNASKPTFLAGLNYKPNKDILAYVKFSTGFVSGGQIAAITYRPTSVRSYEGGLKADLFDRRLRANIAIYQANYTAYQFTTGGSDISPPSPSAAVVITGGNARAKGVEFEASAVPFPGLTLSGNLSYTDFKYTSVSPFLGTLSTFLPSFNPKWTSAVSAQYESPEVIGGAHLSFRVDATYTSSEISAATTLVTGGVNTPYLDATRVPATWIMNGRVALAGFDLGGHKAEVAFYGRNLTNNRNKIIGADLGVLDTAGYQRAREFGAELDFDF